MGTSSGKRTRIIPDSLAQIAPSATMRVDICGRISTCRMCQCPILSGEHRFAISVAVGARKLKNGGIVSRVDRFYHPQCFIAYLAKAAKIPAKEVKTFPAHWSDTRSRLNHCIECRRDCNDIPAFLVRLNTRSEPVRLCTDCHYKNPALRSECSMCHYYVHKYKLSRLVEQGQGESTGLYCDWCVEQYDVQTVKQAKARERTKRKNQQRFERLKNRLEEEYYVSED